MIVPVGTWRPYVRHPSYQKGRIWTSCVITPIHLGRGRKQIGLSLIDIVSKLVSPPSLLERERKSQEVFRHFNFVLVRPLSLLGRVRKQFQIFSI